ncbi:MAG: T9SS type A sorting domain-containing protein [Candidatus Latescibacteria bacterium]|nr:T9SS type A sorting domain-containing protein [Candidatus Latescibacterota bacterium]
MRRRVRAVAAMALALSGLEAGWVSAAEYVVPTDFERLGEALQAAGPGDTVTVRPGEYPLFGHIGTEETELLIRSSGGPTVTILLGDDPWGLGADFTFGWGITPTTVLQGFTFRNFDRSAIRIFGGSPSLSNLVFENCGTTGFVDSFGGAINCQAGSPVLAGVRFVENHTLSGGAFANSGGSPVFFGCSFESNWAWYGGAVHLGGGSPSFIACDFIDNEVRTDYSWEDQSYVDAYGGAVYITGNSTVAPTFSQCRFIHNQALDAVQHGTEAIGGACYTRGGCTPTFTGCTMVDNSADTRGGAVLATDEAQPTFSSTIIAFTSEGGGLVVEGVTAGVTLACCDVYGNNGGDYVGMDDPTGQDGNISANPLFCDPDAREYTLAAGSPCLPAGNDCGVQIGAYGEGCAWPTAVEDAPAQAGGGVALDCHPNPFNPTTVFSFEVPAPARVSLTVYDVTGRHVQSLVHTDLPAGQHAVDFDGSGLGSGVYLAVLRIGERHAERKFTLVK